MRENMRAAELGLDRTGEDFRDGNVVFAEVLLEESDVVVHAVRRLFVDFCEDEREGHLAGFHPLNEGEVDRLRGQAGVDQDKNVTEEFAFLDVVADGFVEIEALLLGNLGVAVAGQIDERPVAVDREKIDELRLAWLVGNFGELCEQILLLQVAVDLGRAVKAIELDEDRPRLFGAAVRWSGG